MKILKPFTACAIAALTLLSTNQAQAKMQKSDYRPNTQVEFIYRQKLDSVYSTDWLAKLENKRGTLRTVYIETVGKFVNKGFIRFDCANPKANVNLKLYGSAEYGDESQAQVLNLSQSDLKAWAKDEFEPLFGEDPPYAFYQKLRPKYCK